MDLKELKHDFQNNYLRLEVLMSLINDSLQKNQKVDDNKIEDFEKFLNLANTHAQQIKEFNSTVNFDSRD